MSRRLKPLTIVKTIQTLLKYWKQEIILPLRDRNNDTDSILVYKVLNCKVRGAKGDIIPVGLQCFVVALEVIYNPIGQAI